MKKELNEEKNKQRMNYINDQLDCNEFKYEPGKPMCGILSSLQKKCGGNIHFKNCVRITASWSSVSESILGSLEDTSASCKKAFFNPNEWIQYDMKDKQILLTHYSIQNHCKLCHLEQWEILGSNDMKNFTIIDKKNIREPKGSIVLKTYTVQNPSNQFYRYIRIKQTGPNSLGNYDFCYNNFEFFGKIKPIS